MTEYIDRTQEPDEAFTAVMARFDAAPTSPEDTVERVAIALWKSDTQGVADPEVIDRLWPKVIDHFSEDAEEYRRLARAAIDALKGTALAVFRDQQDPTVQRVLAVADELDRLGEHYDGTVLKASTAFHSSATLLRTLLRPDLGVSDD